MVMMYFLALVLFILSAALEGTSSDVAAIGGFIMLGLAMQTSRLEKKK